MIKKSLSDIFVGLTEKDILSIYREETKATQNVVLDMPKMRPELAKAILNYETYFCSSGPKKDLFYLTDAEKERGETIANKRLERLAIAVLYSEIFRGTGELAKKMGLTKSQDPQLFVADIINKIIFDKISEPLKRR